MKEKAVGKRTRASVKADVVAPKEEKWWEPYIYMCVNDGLRQVFRDLEARPWCRDIDHDTVTFRTIGPFEKYLTLSDFEHCHFQPPT